ncbi:MAG: peptidylprolyl isomerase, partial [Bacteroidota bacterium]|nr:peptidylprolyl isomerase [Bacteroidota bacterium]
VVAVVGDEMILLSELEAQYLQYKEFNPAAKVSDKCWILEEMMQKKLLLSRAKFDSLKVTQEQVESELDRRMEYFITSAGGEAALEEFYDKSIAEMKTDFRDGVR